LNSGLEAKYIADKVEQGTARKVLHELNQFLLVDKKAFQMYDVVMSKNPQQFGFINENFLHNLPST
jgi:hypothetical protein